MSSGARVALLAFLVAGCAAEGDEGTVASLSLDERPGFVAGTLAYDSGEISFEAAELATETFEMVYELNGLTFSYLVDRAAGVIQMDGYATANGEDTQFTAEDRDAMLSLATALDALGADVTTLVDLARRIASGMAETPDSRELRAEVYAERDRDYVSICWAKNSYQMASHDDNNYDWGADATTLDYAYVSMHAAGPCSDGTYFYSGGSWVCFEPDHSTTIEYAYGNCLGRCGANCGTATQFTWDCLDHDECVRTGHSTASLWCDDEFTSTMDDWASAPNCGK
jgi:hypothetical protein